MNQTYRIPSANMYRLECDLAALNTRARKLGLEPISYEVVREEVTERKTDYGVTVRRFYHITVAGGVAQLNGWHFVAAITPTENGNLLTGIPGEDIPAQYRDAELTCDHCKTKRYRKATYIVRHDDGTYAQVGGNCLGDFVGLALTPAQLAAMAEFASCALAGVEDDGWEGYGSGSSPRSVDTLEFLATVASLARHSGFATRKMVENHTAQRTTGELAYEVCTGYSRTIEDLQDEGWEVTPDDTARAIAAIDWAKTLPEGADTFTHNMRLSALNSVVESRGVGIAAYLIEAYRKAHEVALKADVRASNPQHVSQHVGTVGARMVFDNLTVARIREFDGQFGVTYFISLVTPSGDDILWKASTYQDWAYRAEADASPVTLKATVKEHGEFRGVAQTVITRAQFVS